MTMMYLMNRRKEKMRHFVFRREECGYDEVNAVAITASTFSKAIDVAKSIQWTDGYGNTIKENVVQNSLSEMCEGDIGDLCRDIIAVEEFTDKESSIVLVDFNNG